ncbi:hypothetical protein NC653_021196 [Populus alba x Populus x berolinensis]|uniref:Uncharacterized protein n=1 Tax=Populus alba x Populus x berolinensis TaxID=444605 RepID=A0AAD6QEI3_9ROSI|nr:hypothetical protein NC653_021196 [Populus alba x Populus x berolinensis]
MDLIKQRTWGLFQCMEQKLQKVEQMVGQNLSRRNYSR